MSSKPGDAQFVAPETLTGTRAEWHDGAVEHKARRLLITGRVRITEARDGYVSAQVSGDSAAYAVRFARRRVDVQLPIGQRGAALQSSRRSRVGHAMRNYKRKRNPRGRMLRAIELHAEGKSLRGIAKELGCGRMTVARDLEKWAQENASVSHLPVPKVPPRGEKGTAEWDSSASVIPLRRAE